jgi:hypothetical protein
MRRLRGHTLKIGRNRPERSAKESASYRKSPIFVPTPRTEPSRRARNFLVTSASIDAITHQPRKLQPKSPIPLRSDGPITAVPRPKPSQCKLPRLDTRQYSWRPNGGTLLEQLGDWVNWRRPKGEIARTVGRLGKLGAVRNDSLRTHSNRRDAGRSAPSAAPRITKQILNNNETTAKRPRPPRTKNKP